MVIANCSPEGNDDHYQLTLIPIQKQQTDAPVAALIALKTTNTAKTVVSGETIMTAHNILIVKAQLHVQIPNDFLGTS